MKSYTKASRASKILLGVLAVAWAGSAAVAIHDEREKRRS